MRTWVLDFSETLGRLVATGAKCNPKCPTFDEWTPRFRADLISAQCGGQWPQARLFAVKGWTDTNLGQLCKSAVGTLGHRLTCQTTRPVGGWQPPPMECSRLARNLDSRRREMLDTRALFVLKLSVPCSLPSDTFRCYSRRRKIFLLTLTGSSMDRFRRSPQVGPENWFWSGNSAA